MIPENFKEWACSLSGCDGGNADAKTWLCGIEWGKASYENGIYYKNELPKEINEGKFTPQMIRFDWNDSLKYPYGRSFAKLFAAIEGYKVENYRELALKRDGSELFKLNLYPIAFDSTDESHWQKHNLKKLTGFDDKHIYQTWCFLNRFPHFSKFRKEKKPKLIICTGTSYLRDFLICFGGYEAINGQLNYEEIKSPPKPENHKENKRRYYWIKLDELTTLVVIPFLSGVHGLNSDFLLQEMGKKIKALSL